MIYLPKCQTLFFLLTILGLVSCQSKENRMNAFVRVFNEAATISTLDQAVKSLQAHAEGDTIVLKAIVDIDPSGAQLTSNVIKSAIENGFGNFSITRDLEYHKVGFILDIRDVQNTRISRTPLDFSNKATQNTKALSEIDQMLALLNENLPITDEAGFTYDQIKVSNDQTLEYLITVPDTLVEMMGLEGIEEILQKELAGNPQLEYTQNAAKKLGLKQIAYVFRHPETGASLLNIPFSTEAAVE